ncbi:hypothetical protein NPS01_01980 [Nocardioides psychrotolerans]|uniref:Protein-glutamine gamma-glutamyltransferase-like C-terminal domain-containing protein n=1 Tax=Nocardioides psychrotolerans TaxID=1005945 RepID=A0A1I3BP36_9ACTN|nr:DUF4129 domain-containing protein [Nocardioides psychrotolerans]GEP36535.1 hypothetical protein NPS01_01980 [Nocardioides psychrotolerans]SFH63930.1 protein of unknown function [Nocardioides psychrotolerans]
MILRALLLVPPRADPPLDPTPEEARSLLRRELLAPDYHDQDLVQRLITWLERLIDRGVASASGAPPLQTLAVMVVAVALVAGLVLLLSRARRTARAAGERRAVLTEESVTADQLRARAEVALADGRPEDALVDAFRALALRQLERGRLDDTPGATAHEVALALAAQHPHQRARIDTGADLFDSVLYGDRRATHEQAHAVLTLDDDLAGVR